MHTKQSVEKGRSVETSEGVLFAFTPLINRPSPSSACLAFPLLFGLSSIDHNSLSTVLACSVLSVGEYFIFIKRSHLE